MKQLHEKSVCSWIGTGIKLCLAIMCSSIIAFYFVGMIIALIFMFAIATLRYRKGDKNAFDNLPLDRLLSFPRRLFGLIFNNNKKLCGSKEQCFEPGKCWWGHFEDVMCKHLKEKFPVCKSNQENGFTDVVLRFFDIFHL